MKLLSIGNHMINEQYFIGLFVTEVSKHRFQVEARWLEGAERMGQVVHHYEIRKDAQYQEMDHTIGIEDAFRLVTHLVLTHPK